MLSPKKTISLLALILLLEAATTARAQLVEEFHPPQASCCPQLAAQSLVDMLQDSNQLGVYHDADQKLVSQPVEPGRVVFIGDSITYRWKLEHYFSGKPYVNRGIGGQTTPQMLVRLYSDVIGLKPAGLIILAGTNDLAGLTGPETFTMVENNLRAMTELAQVHKIKVILCSVLPVSDYTGKNATTNRPPKQIRKLNDWIKGYADEAGAGFADYYSVLADSQGMLKEGFSDDGIHPNDRGLLLMVSVAEAAIEKALAVR